MSTTTGRARSRPAAMRASRSRPSHSTPIPATPFTICLGSRGSGCHIDGASGGADKRRRDAAHLSADVPEHAVLRAEQRVRADQFLRCRAAHPASAPTETVTAEYYYSFLWRYSRARRDLYRRAVAGRKRPEQLRRRPRCCPGRVDRPAVGSADHLDDHAARADSGRFGLFFPGAALRAAGGRQRPSSTPI